MLRIAQACTGTFASTATLRLSITWQTAKTTIPQRVNQSAKGGSRDKSALLLRKAVYVRLLRHIHWPENTVRRALFCHVTLKRCLHTVHP